MTATGLIHLCRQGAQYGIELVKVVLLFAAAALPLSYLPFFEPATGAEGYAPLAFLCLLAARIAAPGPKERAPHPALKLVPGLALHIEFCETPSENAQKRWAEAGGRVTSALIRTCSYTMMRTTLFENRGPTPRPPCLRKRQWAFPLT